MWNELIFDIVRNGVDMKSILIILFIVGAYILGYCNNINYERYKIYMHPTYRADQYLLDTKTGDVLHLVEDSKKDKMLLWEPMIVIKTYEDYIRYNSSEEEAENQEKEEM